jgi:hypothetical protein
MPIILPSIATWLAAVHADLYAITAGMALVWAASEVIIGYPERPVRALWTRGAWLLMLANALFACLALAASLTLVPGSASAWMALGVGLSWQAMLRGGINIQPLPLSATPEAEREQGLGVPLNELYSRLQSFCVGQIQRQLVGERVTLMERAIAKLEMADLARMARMLIAALAVSVAEAEQYIQRIETDPNLPEERREIMLISLILDNGGGDILRQRVKEQSKK